MQLRLHHNFTGITYEGGKEWVNVTTSEGDVIKELVGYIDNNQRQALIKKGGERCKIQCFGHRSDDYQSWQPIHGQQFVAGILYQDKLYACNIYGKPSFI